MIVRRYEVDNLSGIEIKLGRVGENKTRCIEFDVRPWLVAQPDGFVQVYAVLPTASRRGYPRSCASDPNGYLAATTMEEGIISWVITSTDTAVDGKGAIELILYGKDGEIMQSMIAKTRISPSLSHSGPHGGCHCGPSPMQPWVDQAARIRMETIYAAEQAEAALEAMQQLVAKESIPDGGKEGQVLAKRSDEDQDVGWVDMTGEVDFDKINIIHGGDANEFD